METDELKEIKADIKKQKTKIEQVEADINNAQKGNQPMELIVLLHNKLTLLYNNLTSLNNQLTELLKKEERISQKGTF
jgi:hypothetical protein